MRWLAGLLCGPASFLILYWLPYEGPSSQGRIVLAIFAWMVIWWIAQPVPWGISSLLPLVLFPGFGLTNAADAAGLYGQSIFFWIMGTILLGHAMQRHGLAKRFALWFLSWPWIGSNTHRLAFGFMLVTGIVSTHLSDAATVAMMMPVAVSLSSFVRTLTGTTASEKSNFGAFLALGAMYASAVGGIATIAGVPYNALSIALLERFTGQGLGWFQWMMAGIPIFLAGVVVFYFLLRFFLPPEVSSIPGGQAFLLAEKKKLGPFSSGERSTLFVFLVMVLLFTLPAVVLLLLGAEHSLARRLSVALPIWSVPVIVLVLLFCTPVDLRKREFVLNWRDAVQHSPWDIMLMCAAAVAVTDTLVNYGLVEYVGGFVQHGGVSRTAIPFLAAYVMAFSTNLFSGTAATSFFGSIFIPVAQQLGFNPASMAMIIPNVAVGLMVPWSGAVAGTAFASGEIDLKRMIRVGFVATLLYAFLVAGIHVLLAPIL